MEVKVGVKVGSSLQAKRVAKLCKQSEQARSTHCVLDDSVEVLGRYVQNTCKGKRHPHGMPSDKKIILKIFLSASWFGFASTLSLAKHSNIFFVTLEEIAGFLYIKAVREIEDFLGYG